MAILRPRTRTPDRGRRVRGKREQAQEHLTMAVTMYREMDMRFWLEQAEVEMSGLA